MAREARVAGTADVAPGTVKGFEVNGKEIALFNIDGRFYATSNLCPHQGGPLSEGMVDGTTTICPWHAWTFDVRTGASPVNPRARIETYPVRVEGEDVYITV